MLYASDALTDLTSIQYKGCTLAGNVFVALSSLSKYATQSILSVQPGWNRMTYHTFIYLLPISGADTNCPNLIYSSILKTLL